MYLSGRRFTDGLQQSIEAKEGLSVSEETQVTAKVPMLLTPPPSLDNSNGMQ